MSQINTQESSESKFQMDIHKMMQNNPQVDSSLVNEATKMIKTLQQSGIEPAQYGLSHPFTKVSIANNAQDTQTMSLND